MEATIVEQPGVGEPERPGPPAGARTPPRPLPIDPGIPLPADSLGYRLKRRLLGPPLHTEELEHERLGKPTALAVFASDNLSSSAYATEEILRVLVPAAGIAAFALVVPITVAMLVVLGFLILSYRQTIKEYPTAGGAYMVTRDNFGLLPAQVAGVALLTDYVLTVSVSVAAGTAALASAFSALTPYVTPISIAFVVIIAFGNLRGVRESGRIFAVPTYFFILNMAALLGWGLFRLMHGDLPRHVHHAKGMLELGHPGAATGLLMGASLYVVMHAFASGGAAVTGVEAISNGVPAFRKPEWKNARTTLVIMGSALGVMFLGLSILAGHMHVVPFEDGTPTVISEVGKLVFGGGPLGKVLFLSLQAGTMLILVLAANTSFADFPRLASFHAGDNFMPRQLTKRGHRLVFSNGIIFLSVASIALLVLTGAKVDRLIPLYAIGVFTSFTLSQAGMARHHIVKKEPGWRSGLFINATGAVMTVVVDVIIAWTKFSHGAWIVIVLVPIMVVFLVRLAGQYEREAEALESDVPAAVSAPVMQRLAVLVFIDRLDLASARALQFARSLRPDEMRAVHFAVDPARAEELAATWKEHGMERVPLEVVDCPDRRLTRTALQTCGQVVADGRTEACVVLPDRQYGGFWRRILHDQTSETLARELCRLPHTNVTTVPFHFAWPVVTPAPPVPSGRASAPGGTAEGVAEGAAEGAAEAAEPRDVSDHVIPIGDVRWRDVVRVSGRVQALRVERISGSATLECTVGDGTGAISLVFLGRPSVAGLSVGSTLTACGRAIEHRGRLAIANPQYTLS